MVKKNSITKVNVNKVLNLIIDFNNLGKTEESLILCRKLEENGIDSADFNHLYGLTLFGIKQYEAAESKVIKAIKIKANNGILLNTLGVIYMKMKKNNDAIIQFENSIKYEPDLFDAWNNLGNALRNAERYLEAEKALIKARKIAPERYEPYLNMALIMAELRAYKNSEKFLDKAIELAKPINAQLLIKRLAIANRAENFEYTEKNYKRLQEFKLNIDEEIEANQIWARYLEVNNKTEEALILVEKWLHIESIHKDQILSIVGMLYAKLGRIKEGISLHEKLILKNPDHITARWNLSILQLLAGNVAEGFKNYEARWLWREFPSSRRQFSITRWHGQNLKGKKLLIWREQGIGDEVRFSSLIPDLKETGVYLTVECSPKMVNLLKHCFPWAEIKIEGQLDTRNDISYLKYDYQIPIGSLTNILRPTLIDFYEKQKPFIPRIKNAESRVRTKLGINEGKILVGICWRSSNQSKSRSRHYLNIEELADLKNINDVVFVSTQYDDSKLEIEKVRKLGLPLFNYVNVNQKDDLLSTIGLLGACDIILTANVSVGDFAAGLGVPVIRIGHKYEPIRLGTENVPWYPTCKYYEMNPGSGSEVINRVIKNWREIIKWASNINNLNVKNA